MPPDEGASAIGDASYASAAATAPPPPESTATPPGTQVAGDHTAGAATSQPEPGPVPYAKFAEAQRERTQFKEQWEGIAPYQSLTEALSGAGINAEEALDLVLQAVEASEQAQQQPRQQQPRQQYDYQQQGQELSPAQQYGQWLVNQGYDLDQVRGSEELNTALWNRYENDQRYSRLESRLEELANRDAESERRSIAAEVTAEMQELSQKHQDLLGNRPELQKAIYALFSYDGPRGLSMAQSAENLLGEIGQLVKDATARYATAKQQDAGVPVVAGGVSPNPTETPELYKMGEQQRRSYIGEYIRRAMHPPS